MFSTGGVKFICVEVVLQYVVSSFEFHAREIGLGTLGIHSSFHRQQFIVSSFETVVKLNQKRR
jgi:hypothetical protein